MSIVACVKVQDGIALGCDSATQISGKDSQGNIGVLKIYENARKLFRFQKLPVGILSYGIGNIGPKSIQTILREFNKEYSPDQGNYTVEEISNQVLKFIGELYNEAFASQPLEKQPVLGIYVAGYSAGKPLGEEWEFRIPTDKEARQVRPDENTGASWRGVQAPFTRLYFGYDPRAINDLVKSGFDEEVVRNAFKAYQASVIYDGMPVKDAVNLIKFILRTTIGLNSFEVGAPSCSEPIQVAVINAVDGFNWTTDRPILYQKEVL